MQVGGPCSTLVDISTEVELIEALSRYPEAVVVGGGSNLLIAEEGFSGTLIRAFSPGDTGIIIDSERGWVQADAPVEWDRLVRATIEAGMQGLESTSGVPGSVGGAVVQNLGAYGQEVADVVEVINVWDRIERQPRTMTADDCQFRYRSSRFKHDETRRFVITGARFELPAAASAYPRYGDVTALLSERHGREGPYLLSDIRDAVLTVRRGKGMVIGASHPSAGSFFTNPILTDDQADLLSAEGFRVIERADGVRLTSAAALIEGVGYERGYRRGNAGLSDQHVLALVNLGGATTNDILSLAAEVRDAVHQRFQVRLIPEPVMLGFEQAPL